MKAYNLGDIDLRQYDTLTFDEREAWLHPLQDSYHSFHIERMGIDTFRWRDSKSTKYYIGSHEDLQMALLTIGCRKLDPSYAAREAVIASLSQEEIDDLLGDL